MVKTASRVEYGVVDVHLEIEIAAAPARVWKALIAEPGRWWPKDFYTSEKTKDFVIEPRLGGRVFEDEGNGAGAMWYTVVGFRPERELMLAGHMFGGCGDTGPATSMLTVKLEGDARRTTLKIHDSTHGKLGANAGASMDEGWKLLFGGLKKHVEAKKN